MNILVFMSDNRSLSNSKEEYHSMAACINKAYCDRHGYDFVYYQPYYKTLLPLSLYNCIDVQTGEKRHASWSKLLSASHAMELGDYDYVFYIDSDCIFKDFTRRIETVFLSGPTQHDILFLNNMPWGDDKPCAGVFLARCKDTTKSHIKSWYDYSIPAKNTKHAWEQDALWCIGTAMPYGLIKDIMFLEKEGQFLRHVASPASRERVPYFTAFLDTHAIDMCIDDIRVIQYDTSA